MTLDSAKADGQTNFGRWVGFAALIAAVYLLWDLRSVLIDLFGSVVLSVAFCTLVRAVQARLGWRRWPSLLLSLLLVLLMVLVVFVALVPPFSAQFQELIEQLPQAAQALHQLIGGDLSSAIQSNITNPEKWNLTNSVTRVLQLAGNFGIGLVQLLFVVAVALMLSVQPEDYRQVAILMAPSYLRRRISGVLDSCGQALSSWMVGVLISSIAVGLMAFVGLSLLGFVWAVVAILKEPVILVCLTMVAKGWCITRASLDQHELAILAALITLLYISVVVQLSWKSPLSIIPVRSHLTT